MPVPGWRWRISLAASMPSRWKVGGMRMSLTTTCGSCSAAAASSSGWSAASPTTSMSGSRARRARTPERTSRLSSARTTVITPSGMPSIQSHLADRGEGAAMRTGGGPAPPREARPAPLGWRAPRRTMGPRQQRRSRAMKIESRVVAVSWIPSEAVKGAMKAPVRAGHRPLRRAAAGRARRPGRLAQAGHVPRRQRPPGVDRRRRRREDHRLRLQRRRRDRLDDDGPRLRQRHLPGRRRTPPCSPSPRWATAGCGSSRPRAAAPACRRPGASPSRRSCSTTHPPRGRRCRSRSTPTVAREFDLVGASPFPRHWVYGPDGKLAAQVRAWSTSRTGTATPSASTARGAARTRRRSSPRSSRPWSGSCRRVIMGEGKPKIRKLKEGAALTTQGEEADAIYLLLDGVIQVNVDGEEIANLGPGALIGERAVLEGGKRTATLVAVSPCKVAEARKVELDLDKLAEVSEGHRREEQRRSVKVHVLGVRGSTPAPGHAFARHGGNTSCVALARDGAAPSLRARRRHRAARPRRAARRAPVPRRAAARPPALGPHPGPAVLPRRRQRRRRGARVHPRTRTTATPPSTCCAAPCRRRTSRSAPRGSAGDWTFESLDPGEHHAGGFEVLALEIPHKGGRTFGYRVSDGRSSIAYLSDHGPSALGPGPDGWGPYHDTALALAADVDLLSTTRSTPPRSCPSRVSWGHSAADYPVRLARAGRRQGRAPLPPRPDPHRRRGRRHRRRLRRRPASRSPPPPRAPIIDL